MNRRDFLRAATGAAGGATVAGAAPPVAAQEETGTETPSDDGTETEGTPAETGTETEGEGGGGGGGGSETVTLVDYAFEPATNNPLVIAPGTTVTFVWETDQHNIVVDSQPDESSWEGHEPIENTGFEVEHTFDTEGSYEFHCQPHASLGMEGTIQVQQGGAQAGGGGGAAQQEVDPEHMGVPIQAHFVGIATFLMLIVSLVYTFFFLKYGESAHSSSPNR